MILSKFGEWTYSTINDIFECDEEWEAPIIELFFNDISQNVLIGFPTDISGVTASNIYDEDMNRIGVLEKKDEEEEYLLFDGWNNNTALFFQDNRFTNSNLKLEELISDKNLSKWNEWIKQYPTDDVDKKFRKEYPYAIIDINSFEEYQHSKEGVVFIEDDFVLFWDSRVITPQKDLSEHIKKYTFQKSEIKTCF